MPGRNYGFAVDIGAIVDVIGGGSGIAFAIRQTSIAVIGRVPVIALLTGAGIDFIVSAPGRSKLTVDGLG